MSATSSTSAISIAVVGHTNAGKTSLLRTLTRRIDFGQVSNSPGTTRQVAAIELAVDGAAVLRLLDTPGLEDAPALLEHLQALDGELPRGQRVQAFLNGPAAAAEFEQEAKVLRCLLATDVGLLVIDMRETPLPKFAAELEVLQLCAKPLLPVLNHVRHADSQEPAWRALLASHGLHACVRFDAVAPLDGAERDLYIDLGALLPARRAQLQQLSEHLQRQAVERHTASLRLLAELLLSLAAYRERVDKSALATAGARAARIERFRARIAACSRQATFDLLSLHGFDRNSAEAAELPALAGRWEADLFNPEALRDAGKRLGTGALVGGAIGLAADVALAGLSLGAAATLGAALGGMASQGIGPLGRKLADKLRGRVELTLEDATLALLLEQQLTLLIALERRGHAALEQLQQQQQQQPPAAAPLEAAPMADLLLALRPARAHPEWAASKLADAAETIQTGPTSPARERQLQSVGTALRPLALAVRQRVGVAAAPGQTR